MRRARTILASVRDLVDYAKHQGGGVLSGVAQARGHSVDRALSLAGDACPSCSRRFPELNLQLRETMTESVSCASW